MEIEPITGDYTVNLRTVNILLPILPNTMLFFPYSATEQMSQQNFDELKSRWLKTLTNKQILCIRTLLRYEFHLGTIRYLSTKSVYREVACEDADSIHFTSTSSRIHLPLGPNIWPVLMDEFEDRQVDQNGIAYYIWLTENIDWTKEIRYTKPM